MYRIKIHTMLNRAKNYSVAKKTQVYINGETLVIEGINEMSKEIGVFTYPIRNIEHYNITEVEGNDVIR